MDHIFSVHENNISNASHHLSSKLQKTKDVIRGCSCNPTFYNLGLVELKARFGSPQHIVTVHIYHLETWASLCELKPFGWTSKPKSWKLSNPTSQDLKSPSTRKWKTKQVTMLQQSRKRYGECPLCK